MTYESAMQKIEASLCPEGGKSYGECYLFTSEVQDGVADCKKCSTGTLMAENTLMLPPVLLGKNAQQVFTAVRCLNFNSYHNSVFYIDFSRVERVDSGGIGALILLRKKIIPRTIEICLINIKPGIYRTFSMCNLNKIFMLKR